MYLNDYYAPLNFLNLFLFMIFFLSMDIIGNYGATLLKFPNFLRSIQWILGLGIFIFFWFLLHFFLPFRQDYVCFSIVLLPIPFLLNYIKNKGIVNLIKVFWEFPYPLIFLLFITQKIFYLVSLPPYVTDELAYHYIPPAELSVRNSWDFTNNINFYYMLPKTLEMSFTLMFSFTKTYAVARLLNFMIFFTSIYAIAYLLKEKTNIIIAIAYSFFILLLFATPLVDSTRGYIDVAPAILSNLLLLIVICWLLDRQKGYFYAGIFLIGFIAGIKYTILGFVSSLICLVIVYLFILNNKKIASNLDIKLWKMYSKVHYFTLIISIALFVIMGGYWYIKNLIVTNNPIYPFVFKCKNNISCSNTNEFFGNFGIQFKIENLPKFIQTTKETIQ